MAEGNGINGNTELQKTFDQSPDSSSQENFGPEDVDPQGTSIHHDVHVQRRPSDNRHRYSTSRSHSLGSSSADSLKKVKIILSGDMGVGKSTFLGAFAKVKCGTLLKSETSQVRRIIKYDNKDIEVNLLDTSGQERYRSLTASYYRNANGCILLFNFDIPQSFYNLQLWLEDIQKYSSNGEIDTVIAGFDTKAVTPTPYSDTGISSDSEGSLSIRSNVTIQQAEQFADSRCLSYVNVSKNPDSVLRAIYCVLERIIDRVILNSSTATNTIRPGTPRSSEGCKCCPC